MTLLGGITGREIMDQAMADGFQFVAMARALLREPDLLNRMRQESRTRSLCNHNKCMTTLFGNGTRCVLVPEGSRSRSPASAGQASADDSPGAHDRAGRPE